MDACIWFDNYKLATKFTRFGFSISTPLKMEFAKKCLNLILYRQVSNIDYNMNVLYNVYTFIHQHHNKLITSALLQCESLSAIRVL